MPALALPSRPSLDQLRRLAKELRDAARSGDPAARARITAHTPGGGTVTLAAAQLTVAREHGYPSWPQLVAEVKARTAELGQRVEEFLVVSVGDWTGRAVRRLARDPWLADYDVRTAVVLGEADRVRQMLGRDAALATRTALHLACALRWHQLDPARAEGLTEVARLLLDRGADLEARDTSWDSTPLEWAVIGSGMRLGHDPDPDWAATIGVLLDAGASTDGIVLAADVPPAT